MTKTTNILLATVAGFAAGVLLAPKSGKETREDLKNKARDAKHYAADKTDQVKGAVHDSVDNLRHGADKLGTEAKEMAESVRRSATKAGHEASKLTDEAKTRAGRVSADAKQTARNTKDDIDRNVR